MARRLWYVMLALPFGAIAALLTAGGCAKPTAPPEQFVGTWIAAPKDAPLKRGAYPTLVLSADGTGVYTQFPDPHPMNVNWVLKGARLILANRDGSGSLTYSYRFNNKDELVIIMERGEVTFRRYEAAPESRQTEAEK